MRGFGRKGSERIVGEKGSEGRGETGEADRSMREEKNNRRKGRGYDTGSENIRIP